ncbi:hypothetical protein [Biformimicrobium ophioploci]|uniref:hypothetical protein n=1 Tax=Biformimicrobium ophioploci TaxID=3036711 RepID=UPI0025567984|nr:hypothetical protein [Microbulbifer sp. NKW57]
MPHRTARKPGDGNCTHLMVEFMRLPRQCRLLRITEAWQAGLPGSKTLVSTETFFLL